MPRLKKVQGKVQESSTAYHAHRERQQRRILDAAWKLFDERGMDRVTMAEITSASGVQASTTYQYFSNKDAVVWAMLGEWMQERSQCAKEMLEAAPNALARITSLLESFADDLVNEPVKVRFLAQFDAMYAHNWPAERLLALESQIFSEPKQWFSELIREGIADGSLRADLNPDLTLQAVINTVIGTQRRLASLGSKVELEYGHPIHDMFRETIRLLLLGLRAPEKAKRATPKKPVKKVRKKPS
jgi:AcrR family transcriptional regulator